jgi:replication factor A2
MNYTGYETTYTSYGAGGGAGGGGFIPGDASQQSPSGPKSSHYEDSVKPVTIKQVLDAQQISDKDWKIDGNNVKQLTCVGQIRNMYTQTTNTTYKLDDGTGTIEAKLWVDMDAAEQSNINRPKLSEGAYCRVWGMIKTAGNKRYIGALIIRPIEDYNEISYHLLEATVVHLYFTRGPLGDAGQKANAAGATAQSGQQDSYTGAAGHPDILRSVSPIARKVYDCLRETEQSNEGLHSQDIAARLGLDPPVVAQAGDELLEVGVIYTTTDDATWAILEE